MTGDDLELSRDARRTSTRRRASRSCSCSSRTRVRTSSTTSPASSRCAGQAPELRQARSSLPALRDRARRRDPLVAVDRLRRSTRTGSPVERRSDHRPRLGSRRRKDLALVLQTGALPVRVRDRSSETDISATLGEDSLRQALVGGDRRPHRRRALPAHLLPLPRRRRGHRPRDLRACSSTARSCCSTSR